MHFDDSLLTAADQTALAAALAAIPALKTPLDAAIAAAQAAAAPVVSLQTQIAAARSTLTGGMVPLSFNALCDQLNAAEANCFAVDVTLHAACQNLEPLVVQTILPIATREAVRIIQNADAGLVSSGGNEFNAGPLGSSFVTGLSAFFRSCFGPRDAGSAAVLAKATKLQTLLYNIGSGTDFYSVS